MLSKMQKNDGACPVSENQNAVQAKRKDELTRSTLSSNASLSSPAMSRLRAVDRGPYACADAKSLPNNVQKEFGEWSGMEGESRG